VVDGDANRPTDQCGMEDHSDHLTEMLWVMEMRRIWKSITAAVEIRI
jgi:hypothetical protein